MSGFQILVGEAANARVSGTTESCDRGPWLLGTKLPWQMNCEEWAIGMLQSIEISTSEL